MDDKAKILNFPFGKGTKTAPDYNRASSHVKPIVTSSPFEQKRESLRPQYPKLSDSDLGILARTEFEKAPCANCKGECSKEISRWSTPLVEVTDSKVKVEYALCPFGLKRFEQREFTRAGIPDEFHDKTFVDYKASVDNNAGKAVAREILYGKKPKGGYFYGASGTGKTFLAALVAQDFLRDFRHVRFLQSPADGFTPCDLLVLDGIDEWSPTQTAIILNRCSDEGQLLIATARIGLDSLEERLGGDNFAKRITSRLKATTKEAFFGTHDWRRTK